MSGTSGVKEGKKKKKIAIDHPMAISWKEKKDVADREEEALEKEIQDLRAWTDMIDVMNDEQLKEYLKNRPDELKTEKIQKPKQKIQRIRKCQSSASVGIMASVWKFHREEEEDED